MECILANTIDNVNMIIFHDFCQRHAWKTKFPHCESPDIWEGDPKSNLAHHKVQDVCLR